MKKLIASLVLFCSILTTTAWANFDIRCENLLTQPPIDETSSTETQNEVSLRFLTLNTQGFRIYRNLTPEQKAKPKQQRYFRKVAKWAQAVATIDADITVLQEVHSDYEVEYLIREHLNDEYDYFLKPGNDPAGSVVFLVKKGLPFEYEYRSHSDTQWKGQKLFTRDAPVLILRSQETGSIITAIIGHHAKSQKDRAGDKRSRKLRTQQNKEIANIASKISSEFGQIPVLAAGDFNADLHKDESAQVLSHRMTDVFDLLPRPPPRARRVTFSYFKNNIHNQNQLDGIVVHNPNLIQVRRADVYRYRDEDGNEYPLPETIQERLELPSDHNPVWADVSIPL